MKVRELDEKSDDELRQLADDSFASMEERGTGGWPMLSHEQPSRFSGCPIFPDSRKGGSL
jgi:hypothetical protein